MTRPDTGVVHPPWPRQAAIHEVSSRRFTPEGTLRAFDAHLPRLAQMGVGILWFMPIQPIGVKHRKGTLGSYDRLPTTPRSTPNSARWPTVNASWRAPTPLWDQARPRQTPGPD